MKRTLGLFAAFALGVAALVGCTDAAPPDTAPSISESSDPSASPSTEQPDAEALLAEAQTALRDADAVRISSRSSVVQGSDSTTQTWHGVWSYKPQAWMAGTSYRVNPGRGPSKRYSIQCRYLDGTLVTRSKFGAADYYSWNRAGNHPTGGPRPPGMDREHVANYPVAVLIVATAIDAVSNSEGAIIRAEVPNSVADVWLDAKELLDANGLPGALTDGSTEITITVDESGFPVKVTYSGDDMELTSEIPDYMWENLSASGLTAYYSPTELPRQLHGQPSTDG